MKEEGIDNLATEFLDAELGAREDCRLPTREAIAAITHRYVSILLPVFLRKHDGGPGLDTQAYLQEINRPLTDQICHALQFDARVQAKELPARAGDCAAEQTEAVLKQLPELAELLAGDIHAAFSSDPAAPSREAIVLSYPGLEAITVQRLAHRLYLMGVPFIPRMMTEVAHSRTGIDIHPGASIGEKFFIDHGTGVVIGETATIGRSVVLYHGVTLGAFNPLIKDQNGELQRGQQNKRHPDLEDHVTVYPSATILGGNTRVGHHSVIGGNVWLTRSVPPFSTVVIRDPELVIRNRAKPALAWDI